MVRKPYVAHTKPNDIRSDLENLPLGALRRAQQLLKRAVTDSGSDSDEPPDELQTKARDVKGKAREKVEWSTKPLIDGGRRNKHA